ncbi:hypothetical protein [Nonomuraea typhae]|uniref:hypothetical protein n=1 Tax=Nonomuraea typhae TaxID=2603600 RepID=UPI0012F8C3FD|nr:hypothetical protein [Nonomuraea typhae]
MDDVEPLRMPPMLLYLGKTPAFLLAWRRGPAGWEGRLAIPQSQVDVRGQAVHGLNYRWAPAGELGRLPGADYADVPRPGPGEEDPAPLRMPPMVLAGGNPAFLLAWAPFTAEGRQGWEGCLAVPPAADGGPRTIAYERVRAGSIAKLPEADYTGVPVLNGSSREKPPG